MPFGWMIWHPLCLGCFVFRIFQYIFPKDLELPRYYMFWFFLFWLRVSTVRCFSCQNNPSSRLFMYKRLAIHPSIINKQMMMVSLRYSPINQAWSAPLLLHDPAPPGDQSHPTFTCLPACFTSFELTLLLAHWIVVGSNSNQFNCWCSFFRPHYLLYNYKDVNMTLEFPSGQHEK